MSSGKLVGSGLLSSSGARSSIGLDHGGIMSPGAGRVRKEDHIEFLFDCHYKQNHDVDDIEFLQRIHLGVRAGQWLAHINLLRSL